MLSSSDSSVRCGIALNPTDSSLTLPDVGVVEGRDIVRFVPTSLGETTAGSFEMYFDGSDVNLDSGSVIHAAEGLAVWPNLVYTLPSK